MWVLVLVCTPLDIVKQSAEWQPAAIHGVGVVTRERILVSGIPALINVTFNVAVKMIVLLFQPALLCK